MSKQCLAVGDPLRSLRRAPVLLAKTRSLSVGPVGHFTVRERRAVFSRAGDLN
jgi:hypothetical protein